MRFATLPQVVGYWRVRFASLPWSFIHPGGRIIYSIRGAALSTGGRVSHPYSCLHPVAEVHYCIRVCGTEYDFTSLFIAIYLIYRIQ